MRVLHLIDKIGAGGPVRSLLALVSNTRAARPLDSHHLVALCEGGYPPLLFTAKRLGIDVIRAPDPASLEDEIAEADVVLVHFWNTPALWSLLSRKLPAARVVFWMKIRGAHPPQRFCGDLLPRADKVLLTSPPPPSSPASSRTWTTRSFPGSRTSSASRDSDPVLTRAST